MSASPFGSLERLLWALLPIAITLSLAMFCLIPKHMVGLSYFSLPLFMIPMFFWGLLQPRAMPMWFVFFLGLAIDAVQGLPMGLSSLTYLAFRIFIELQRKYIVKEGFMMKWAYFALLLLGVGTGQWLVLGFATSQMPSVLPALMQLVLTICLYPVFHQLFDLLFEQAIHRSRRIAHGR